MPGLILALTALVAPLVLAPPAEADEVVPKPTIYLAGPLGFSEAGRQFMYGTLIPELSHLGYEVIDPWKLTDPAKIAAVVRLPYGEAKRHAWQDLDPEIGENSRRGIDAADKVIAVLDGADVDSGTASEIGYAFAKGKPVFGYRGDFRLASDNDGAIINLQVEYFIRQSGGAIVGSLSEQRRCNPHSDQGRDRWRHDYKSREGLYSGSAECYRFFRTCIRNHFGACVWRSVQAVRFR
jgi:nucleoside 2-deoxyribosyltransferase